MILQLSKTGEFVAVYETKSTSFDRLELRRGGIGTHDLDRTVAYSFVFQKRLRSRGSKAEDLEGKNFAYIVVQLILISSNPVQVIDIPFATIGEPQRQRSIFVDLVRNFHPICEYISSRFPSTPVGVSGLIRSHPRSDCTQLPLGSLCIHSRKVNRSVR